MSDHILSDRVRTMNESATIAMTQKARELKNQGINIISLSIGEPDFDTPVHIKEAAKDALDNGWTKYTPVPGLDILKKAIQAKFERDNNLTYDLGQITVSTGAKQSIANVCLSLINPGDEVIIFAPYWVSYVDIVEFVGGKPVIVKAEIEQDFKVSPEQLKSAISERSKLIIFSSPCNPTGSVYDQAELAGLAQVILEHENLYVLSDEIYEYINFLNQHTSIGAIPGMIERTITVNGFSKGFAMTGWRLGYMGAPQFIASACNKVQGQFTSGANSFGQMAGAFALQSDLEPSFTMRDAFLHRRDVVISLLKDIPGFVVNQPQGAFYIFPDVSHYFGSSFEGNVIRNSDDFAEYILSEAHVAVVAGSAFGDDHCIRISYAAAENLLREAIRRIKDAVSKLK